MTDFAILTDHPDYEEIISQVALGKDPKDIAQWLKVKYSNKEQKHLHISIKTIQNFIEKHADLNQRLKEDVTAVSVHQSQTNNHRIAASLMNNKTYMERLQLLADAKVDHKKMITELILMCQARMEQVFDKIQENPTGFKADYVLLKYFEVLFQAMEKFDKIVNQTPDQVIQINVQNQIADQFVPIYTEAIRETLAHIDAESALLFIEIFTEKFAALQYKGPPPPTEPDLKSLRELSLPFTVKDKSENSSLPTG